MGAGRDGERRGWLAIIRSMDSTDGTDGQGWDGERSEYGDGLSVEVC